VDVSRQRAVRPNRRTKWRDRQHQALQVRTDLRADRRAAAAEALAAAARLPNDGAEALARGVGQSDQSRAEAFSLRRRRGDPPWLQGKNAHRLSLELGRAVWEREETLVDPAAISLAAHRAGLDPAELRAGAPSDAELDRLHEKFTQEALAAGVFGAPSYVLPSGEIFWGQDRLDLLERALKKLAR
jgi:hypothetical protein